MANLFNKKFSLPLLGFLCLTLGSGTTVAEELELVVQSGHRMGVVDSHWLDSERLVSVSRDGSLKVWYTPGSRVRRTMWPLSQDSSDDVDDVRVTSSCQTKDGIWVLQHNGVVRLWNPNTGASLKTVKLPVDWFGSSGQIVADSQGQLYCHNEKNKIYVISPGGQVKTATKDKSVVQIAVSSDGKHFAYSDTEGVHLGLDQTSRTLPQSFATHWGIDELLFSEDGTTLLVAASTNWIEAWNSSSGELLFRRPVGDNAPSEKSLSGASYGGTNLGLSLAPYDEQQFAIQAYEGQVFLTDQKTGDIKELASFDKLAITDISFNPDKSAIAASGLEQGLDRSVPLLKESGNLWKQSALGGRSQTFYDLERSGNLLFMAGEGNTVSSLDLTTGQPRNRFKTGYFPVMESDSDTLFAGGNDSKLIAFSSRNGEVEWERKLSQRRAQFGRGVVELALNPSRGILAVLVRDVRNSIYLLDKDSGKVLTELNDVKGASALAFSSDGSQLFFSAGAEIKLYDLRYRKLLHSWKLKGSRYARVMGMVNHPLGDALLAVTQDGKLFQMDKHRLDLDPELKSHLNLSNVRSLELVDGKLLVSAGRQAHLLSTSGEKIRSSEKLATGVSDAIMVNDKLVTTSWDSKVNVWNKNGQILATLLTLDQGKEWLVTTPNLSFDGSEKAQALIEWRWKGKLYEISRFFERYYQPGLLARIFNGTKAREASPAAPVALANTPPKVSIKSPKALGEDRYEIEIEVEGEHSGWEDVRLYHNGHRVAGTSPYKIKAMRGKNRLRASAFNSDKTVESEPHKVSFMNEGPAVKSTLHIFCAAVNDYPNALDFAVEDAKSFAGAFEPGLFDEVKKVTLFDRKATKKTITEALAKIECEPQDTLLVFLAGHGTIIEDRFHFLPHGTDGQSSEKALSSRELGGILSKLPATRQVLFLDTCHAGASAKDLADLLVEKNSPLLSSPKGAQLVRDQKILARQAGTFLVAGSSPEATAAEVPQLGHGLFTYAVLDGLKTKEDAQDEEITVNELLQHLNRTVPELSQKFRGSPHGIWQFSAGQDFPIARPK